MGSEVGPKGRHLSSVGCDATCKRTWVLNYFSTNKSRVADENRRRLHSIYRACGSRSSPTALRPLPLVPLRHPSPLNDQTAIPMHATDEYDLPGLQRQESFVTVVSDTAPNLRGHGRSLDRFYSFWGAIVERTVNRLVHRAGIGPLAVEREAFLFFGRGDDWGWPGCECPSEEKLGGGGCKHCRRRWDLSEWTDEERRKVQKACKKLVRCAQCVVE